MPYRERNLIDYVPSEYRELRESEAILTAQDTKFKQLNADIQDVLAQFFVDTATWGLAKWERIVGVETDESKPIDERRSVIKAKLRGAGVVTVDTIKNVAESWYGGEVEVLEDYPAYKITVKFVSDYGVPSNLDDVENALREIIPAHLALYFEFLFVVYNVAKEEYSSYNDLISQGRTYEDVLNGGLY